MPALYFPIVSKTDQIETNQSFARTVDIHVYAGLLAFLLLTWLALSVATAILWTALFLPGHLGLSGLLRAINDLLPTDPASYTT
jgi:hypothetical protein